MNRSLGLRVWRTAEEAMYRPDNSGGGGTEPAPIQLRYVATTGSDVSGTGSFAQPYATVSAAIGAISDASAGKPYVIFVSPGPFTDDVALADFISVHGVDPSDPPSFSGALSLAGGTTVTGISSCEFTTSQNISLGGANFKVVDCTFDSTVSISGGMLTLKFNRFGSDTHFTDNAALISQDNTFVASDGGCTVGAVAASCVWLSNGDDFGSSLNVEATVPQTLNAQLIGSQCGGGNTLTLLGVGVSFAGTAGAIPPGVALVGGAASPILWTEGNSIGYSAITPGNWAVAAPDAVSDKNVLANSAIDRLAAAVEGLLGGPIP